LSPNSSEPKRQAAIPKCPQCQDQMVRKRVELVLFASNLDDVTYGCEKCGTEMKRTVSVCPVSY
jgi:NAD-dependent SIR2 family protein deacetylase